MGIFDDFFDSLPRFNWTGIDLDESINKWAGDALSPIADLMGMDDNDIKATISMLSDVPIIGDYFKLSDNMKQKNDYLNNRGLEWSDVKYPSLINTGSGNMMSLYGNTKNFVSKNIERLYR